jgi:hypothetical protein
MTSPFVRTAAVFAALFALAVRAEAQSQKPMVLVTIKSMKEFITKAKELTKSTMAAAGQDAMWPMVEAGLDSKLGKEGEKIPGLDVNKPIGIRIMYKEPGPGMPIDGDVLLMLPTTDAAKLTSAGFQSLGLPAATAGDGGVMNFNVVPAVPGFIREANGYVNVTVVDASLVSADKLPKPSEVFAGAKHDMSFMFRPSAFPEKSIRGFFEWAAQMNPGQPPTPENSIQQFVEMDAIEYAVDLDPSAGKIMVEMTQSAKPGTNLSKMFKATSAGPLKSAIGVSPSAAFSMAMRGDYVGQSQMIPNILQQIKAAPTAPKGPPLSTVLELLEELGKSELEDFSVSIAKDGTLLLAAAVKSTSGFELKIGEVVDKLGEEIAKDAGDEAAKVKEKTKKNAVTVAGVQLSRIYKPLPNKKPADAANIYLGAKDNVAFVAVAFSDDTKSIEEALKRPAIDSYDPIGGSLDFKAVAEAFGVKSSTTAVAKISGQGGDPFKVTMDIPVKAIAELHKDGLFDKIKQVMDELDGK